MIEKMKKFTFLVTDREYDGFIHSLRQMGVVHVEQLQQGAQSPALQEALATESRYKQALQALATYAKTYSEDIKPQAEQTPVATPAEALDRVEALIAEENRLLHAIDATKKDIAALEPWGDFDLADVKRLADATGQKICFFRSSSKFFAKEWVDNYFATPINELSKSTYFVTFSTDVPDIQAERIFLPKATLSSKYEALKQQEAALEATRGELLWLEAEKKALMEAGLNDTVNKIQLERVHLSDERVAGDMLRLLIGWVRADATEPLTQYLDTEKIYYEMENPAFEDEVPIQITNNSFSRLFEPILKMYSLPNYNDLDPTVFFAPFFMLFFGLCMGDAGYGLLIFLVGLFLALKGSSDMKAYGRLAVWLGASTVVCGLATATVFGINLSEQDWAFIQPLKPYFINDSGVGQIFGYTPMMVISVIIGLVQVLLGMVLKGCKAIKNYGWPYAVGSFSWVAAIILGLVLYGLPACGVALPAAIEYVLLAGIGVSALGIFLYNSPASYKNPALGLLSNIGGGVWSTYGMATGLLGDLLSYIRLFALGLTGGVLGGVFNSLALDMTNGMSLAARIPVMVLILLAGHGITFALSMISAFVHPMRLTFVEFFKNADFAGGGKAYDPFRER